MLINLFNFDTKSLIGVLVWTNIATGIIVYLYQKANAYKTHYDNIREMTIIRFLSAIGYLMLFLRDGIHDVISVNIGNTLLYLCYYMEARLMLKLVNADSKKTNNILLATFLITSFIFNVAEISYRDASLRVGMASIIIFAIFLLPAAKLIMSKKASKFKREVSVFYIFLLLALIPRSVESLLYRNVNILTNNYYQTLLFISLILMTISNTIIYLLFMKEQTDVIIEKMATIDNLTNILNRHSFLLHGKQAFENHKSSGTGLSLLFFDIDYFKSINDTYGHLFGDEVLIRFANIIKNNIRPSDLCCRYGGEEFIVLLKNANENAVQIVAGRIMREIEKITFESYPDFHVTTSVGSVSGVPKEGELLEDYIKKGDQALYQAKKAGRNKLVIYDDNKKHE